MIPNLIAAVAGLLLTYAAVLQPTWVEQRYLPFAAFAAVFLATALWARRSDAHPWFSSVNIALAIVLGILSLLPLGTLPAVAFWGGFWVGVLVPTIALWSALYRPRPAPVPAAGRAGVASVAEAPAVADSAAPAAAMAVARAADPVQVVREP